MEEYEEPKWYEKLLELKKEAEEEKSNDN